MRNCVKFFKKNTAIVIILLLAGILRLWNLESIPPHLRNDEAALGYNAYSILKTGKDEHGKFLPVVFQSFGDWKMGGYVYLTVPFIKAFGLNELAVRLPSALSGIISVWLIYKIVNLLFAKKRLSAVSAFIFAISPVNVAFSRGAWEVNVSLTLTLAAILFFLQAVFKKKVLLMLSALFFGLTLLTSHTAKLSTPILLLILSFAFFDHLKKIGGRIIILSVLIGLIFAIPITGSIVEGKITRLTTLSIFSYQSGLPLFQSIANRWFSVYSASTLFIKGDTNPQHTAPNTGPLLFLDGIFMLVGLITLIRKGTSFQNFFIFSTLFLLSLPSILTIEKVNLERILPVFIPMIILVALGINRLTKFLLAVFTLLYLLNFVYFLDQYFIHGPKKNDAWQYGYKQIVQKVTPLQSKYEQIIVEQSLEQPYIFFLFYQKYDPQKYQQIVSRVFIPNQEGKDMGLVSGIDNIKFEKVDWQKKIEKTALYVLPVYKLEQQSKFYKSFKVSDEVKDLNGFPLFKIIKNI